MSIPTVQEMEQVAPVVREKRDALLSSTDWWGLSDHTMTADQIAYRQALREIPEQAGFPTEITWPTKPE